MKLKVVPAVRGLGWVRDGVRVCLKQPLGFVSLLGLFFTAAMLLMAVPVVGALVVVSAMPAVWMAFMLASRRVLSGRRITPGVLLEPVKAAEARGPWLRLGALYALATALVVLLGGVLGPSVGDLSTALGTPDQAEAVLSNPAVQSNLLWRLALTIPVSLLFWHTPALVHWSRLPIRKALFFSAVASWRNLGAFALYGVGWMGLLVVVGVVMQVVLALVPVPALGTMIAVLGGMWVASAFYASLYFSVVDCFEPSASPADEDSPMDGGTAVGPALGTDTKPRDD